MTDFHVCPQALRMQADEIKNTATHYETSARHIGEHRMARFTLGIFGQDVANVFNDTLTDVSDKLTKGKKTIASAGDGISACAKNYENLDADYYRKFGYINEQLGY
ncbi:type VII secretion target [Nocardia macrotermitis]|uniref:Excreted virulence factor EspC (Type VII ESX diderm) n=1 Tax=Nocardia macrotermitis TaxID=2585198 RepID=A0A7K0D4L2_9NOCA|nr:type VII secretion target [Nocardia macrotermitis]MQY20511.1 hypothetical protein [Nocardia macrotermitis]